MRSISVAALLAALLCVPSAVQAAPAYDTITACASANTNPLVCTHTPVGTPRAILVYIIQSGDGVDQVGACTYGGTAMTEVTGSPVLKTTGEAAATYAYFLGASVATGAQDVSCSATTNDPKRMRIVSITGAADMEVVDSDSAAFNSDSATDPTATLSLSGRTSFASIGFFSGGDSTAAYTQFAGWTARDETDPGVSGLGVYTYDTVSTADVSAGVTQTTEDIVGIAVAVAETGAASKTCPGLLLGFAGCK
jgi:hypothetical protein